MRDVELKMKERAAELLKSGEVARVIGWKKGEFISTPNPPFLKRKRSLKTLSITVFAGRIYPSISLPRAKNPARRRYF